MTQVYLIRHAETEWNQGGLIQGSADVPLTEDGLQQMNALADHLDGILSPHFTLISSDLRRCSKSAELIGLRRDIRPQLHDELREVDFGRWTGKKIDELRADPDERQAWDCMVPSHVWGGGESFATAHERAARRLTQILAKHPDECVVVVTHGFIIQLLLSDWLCASLETASRFFVGNASMSIIEAPNTAKVRLRMLNKRLGMDDNDDASP